MMFLDLLLSSLVLELEKSTILVQGSCVLWIVRGFLNFSKLCLKLTLGYLSSVLSDADATRWTTVFTPINSSLSGHQIEDLATAFLLAFWFPSVSHLFSITNCPVGWLAIIRILEKSFEFLLGSDHHKHISVEKIIVVVVWEMAQKLERCTSFQCIVAINIS